MTVAAQHQRLVRRRVNLRGGDDERGCLVADCRACCNHCSGVPEQSNQHDGRVKHDASLSFRTANCVSRVNLNQKKRRMHDAPRPCLENLIVLEIKTNKQTRVTHGD